MLFREATLADIPQLQAVRLSVKENVLSNLALVTKANYINYLTERGKGWVCEIANEIVAFAIVDVKDCNVWALFVRPDFEGKGVGRQLHQLMLDWYFKQTKEAIWLSTASNTRADAFYRRLGWVAKGMHGTRETRFEMTVDEWEKQPG